MNYKNQIKETVAALAIMFEYADGAECTLIPLPNGNFKMEGIDHDANVIDQEVDLSTYKDILDCNGKVVFEFIDSMGQHNLGIESKDEMYIQLETALEEQHHDHLEILGDMIEMTMTRGEDKAVKTWLW